MLPSGVIQNDDLIYNSDGGGYVTVFENIEFVEPR